MNRFRLNAFTNIFEFDYEASKITIFFFFENGLTVNRYCKRSRLFENESEIKKKKKKR